MVCSLIDGAEFRFFIFLVLALSKKSVVHWLLNDVGKHAPLGLDIV